MESFTKEQIEKFGISLDFATDLTDDDSIATATVSALARSTGLAATSTVIVSSAVDGTEVQAVVQAGTPGEIYEIRFTATTAAGMVYSHVVAMWVR
jgi:hypothetical protein